MIAERYQLSSLYSHQNISENVTRKVQDNSEMRLGELVTQLLFEIKLTVIKMQVEKLEADIKEAQAANDVDRQLRLLSFQPELLAQRNEICKRLGNRIINL